MLLKNDKIYLENINDYIAKNIFLIKDKEKSFYVDTWCNGYHRRKWTQILDETDCISHSTNTLGKGINPIILPPAIGNSRTD